MGKHQMTKIALGLQSKGGRSNHQKVEEYQPTSKQWWGFCLQLQIDQGGWEWSSLVHGGLLVWVEAHQQQCMGKGQG